MKLKLKDIVLKYNLNSKIVLRFNSELFEIEDENGDVEFLFSLLNGEYNEYDIIHIFKDKYPQVDILEYLETLKELRVIEYVYNSSFNEYYLSRWSRNFDFFDALSPFSSNKFDYQNKIFNAKVCLIGCGGLGSHILYELAAIGVLNITIVDFDKIELSNLNRQILYKESDIGKSKVLTAKNNILSFSPKMNIKAVEKRIYSYEDIFDIIKDHSIVISVADKPRDSIVDWLNKACVKAKIPFINGGLNLARASFYSVIPGKTGCAECWHNSISGGIQKEILNKDIQNKVGYQMPAPAMSPLVSVAAGIMVSEAIKIITGISHPSLTNKLKVFDFLTNDIKNAEEWKLNPNCIVCGDVCLTS